MTVFVINGKFMADRMQGIVRHGREMVSALDSLLDERMQVELVVPPNVRNIPTLRHIKVNRLGKRIGIAWEQIDLGAYVRADRKRMCINFCNTTPLFIQPGITTIHDVMYKAHPEFYQTLRNRISRRWHTLQYRYITHRELCILTDSEFSKRELELFYPSSQGKIRVIPCGWQHVLRYRENDTWQASYPELIPGEFFFSMATLAKNKNGVWIIETARKNPDYIFAIAGKHYETDDLDIPDNVLFLGFISDEDACSLIKHCKAFLFPSLYEGFGLPPLEALALGAHVIASNAASIPEVLGESAQYIDPKIPCCDIASKVGDEREKSSSALQNYSWEASARELIRVLKDVK